MGKSSIIHLIQNSPDFCHRFANNVKAMGRSDVGGTVRNLQHAKHRFDSTSKPIGRFIPELLLSASSRLWGASFECKFNDNIKSLPYQEHNFVSLMLPSVQGVSRGVVGPKDRVSGGDHAFWSSGSCILTRFGALPAKSM